MDKPALCVKPRHRAVLWMRTAAVTVSCLHTCDSGANLPGAHRSLLPACSLGPTVELALQTVPAKRAHRPSKCMHEATRLAVRQNQRAPLSDLPLRRVVIRPLPVRVPRVATQRAPPGRLRQLLLLRRPLRDAALARRGHRSRHRCLCRCQTLPPQLHRRGHPPPTRLHPPRILKV
jgi:hypothetical protein